MEEEVAALAVVAALAGQVVAVEEKVTPFFRSGRELRDRLNHRRGRAQ